MPFIANNVPYALTQLYESLVKKLEDAATRSDCGTVKETGHFVSTGRDTYVFTGYLFLSNWRQKPTSTKNRLQILVQAQEQIRGPKPNYLLMHSTVRVGYFIAAQSNARLLHGVHFDHGPQQDCHPIFHAQITNETIALGDYAQELEFEFTQIPCSQMFGNARIPTSDMTLPSVLVCLAADHIREELFSEFLGSVRELQTRMPQPVFTKTRTSLQAEPNHLRSSHWFAHI